MDLGLFGVREAPPATREAAARDGIAGCPGLYTDIRVAELPTPLLAPAFQRCSSCSDKAIQALKADPARPSTKHHDPEGHYLWVARSGSKTWRKDYRWQGARRTFTFGSYPDVRLADARRHALELNGWIKAGIDPRTQSPNQRSNQAENSGRPFCEIARAWYKHHSSVWSPRYCRDMREKLDHFVLPALGQLDIESLTRSDIETRLIAPIVARGAHEQARRCNDVARRVIEHAVDLELRPDNPAVKARKIIAATRVTHYHRICWVELPELLEAIDRFEQQNLAERSSLIALRLMMPTLVRSCGSAGLQQ